MSQQVNQPSVEEVIEQTKKRLAAFKSDIPIVRSNEFCDSETFFDHLAPVVVDVISKIVAGERSPYQAEICSRKSETELLQSIRFNSSIALDSAIAYGSVAVRYLQKDDPNRGIVISMFGRALRRRWRVTKEDQHLDEAIYYFQKTIEFEPQEEPNRLLHFDDLGCALRERYILRHNDADFGEAKNAFECALAKPFDAAPAFLSNLGRLYKDKAMFVAEQKSSLLQESLKTHLNAVSSVTPEFKGSLHYIYYNLAEAYLELHGIDERDPVGNLKDGLEEKIRGAGIMWMFLYKLGVILRDKFSKDGQHSDALQSIAFLRASLKESSDKAMVNSALGDILEQYGFVIDSEEMLTEGYILNESEIESSRQDNLEVLWKLRVTSLALTKRFVLTNNPDDIHKAVSLTERALASSSMEDSMKWKFQQILGAQLGYRFQVTEESADLEKGISLLKAALDFQGLSERDRATTLQEYGRLLSENYRVSKNQKDLEDALQSFETAIQISGRNSEQAIYTINEFSHALLLKFQHTGNSEFVQSAIDFYLDALKTLEEFPHMVPTYKPKFHLGIGNAFFSKFEVWDQSADLDQAIFYYRNAVNHTDQSDFHLAGRVGSLGRALLHKSRATGNTKFLKEAQDRIDAVLTSPNSKLSPHNIAHLQNTQGSTYAVAFELGNEDLSSLDAAAECFRLATESGCTLPNLVNPPTINRIRALIGRYELTKMECDLKKVVAEAQKLPKFMNHPNSRETFGYVETLARLATLVYDTKKNKQLGAMGMLLYTFAAKDNTAIPERRISASLQSARLTYEIICQPTIARNTLVSALELLPDAVLMGSNRGDQLRAARHLVGLPSLIVSFSLAADDPPADVLRRFEQSRSLLWSRLLDTKTDLSVLHEKYEDIAVRFEQVLNRLNCPVLPVATGDSSTLMQLRQHQLALDYNEIVRLIRSKEGFENFLLLEEPSRLIEYASHGPIVVLNSSEYRADAIVITSEAVINISLPDFKSDNCRKHGALFLEALAIMHSQLDQATQRMDTVLKWIWNAAAKPVLEKLGMTSSLQRSRIWWIRSSWANIFPIHAAGDHGRALETGEPCTVMDRVISSYIPTLRVLDFLRKSAISRSTIMKDQIAILVKMPMTPDDADLPYVEREAAAVEQILRPSFLVTSLNKPKRNEVLSRLKVATMVHFSCHGTANKKDPSLSQLKLQDWKTNPLDVRTLLRTSCDQLEFVYLSACETATSKLSGLEEESVHLSGAFQMAGVPYTVASLWNIEDEISEVMASDFYAFLKENEGVFDFKRSAEALHTAAMNARNRSVSPLLWGAFVQFGV